MRRFVYLILALVIILFGVTFAVLNADKVQLNYYMGSVEWPLSLIVVLAMTLGAILGIFASLGIVIGSRRQASKLKKSVEVAEKEIINLRNIPIKDKH